MDKDGVLKRLKAVKEGSNGWCALYTVFGRKCAGVCPLVEMGGGCGLQSMITALEGCGTTGDFSPLKIEEDCCQDTLKGTQVDCLKSLLKRIQALERDQKDYYAAAKINHWEHQADHKKIESHEFELQRIRDHLYAIGRKGNGA